jgi:hypothetical protein
MIFEPDIENVYDAPHFPIIEIEKWDEKNGAII